MPTYEYQCEKCEKKFDLFQSMKDNALTTCPKDHCQMHPWGEGKVKRLLGTGAGIIFKGSGFYQTDYRSSGYKEAAKKDVAPTASSTPATSTSSSTSPGKAPAAAPSAPAKSSE